MIWPLLRIVPIATSPETVGAQAVLLTSAHAARSIDASALKPRPPLCLCVGEATALAARAAGFAGARAVGGGNAAEMAGTIATILRPADGALLFIRGETVAGHLAEALREAGFAVRETVIYRAEPTTVVPPLLGAMLDTGRIGAVTVHSTRGAATFAGLARRQGWRLNATTAVAISARAAEPLRDLGFEAISVAPAANDDGIDTVLNGLRPRLAGTAVGGTGPGPLSSRHPPEQE